jgi:FAD/FMN-containing dehydrogenase
MNNIDIINLHGGVAAVSAENVAAFQSDLRGDLFRPDDPGYDEARAIWNAMIDKRPALIARCSGVADVIRSVAFARDHNLLTAVRSGGHNIAGNAVCNGGLVIDLSRMNRVRIDALARRAHVEPGATLGDFDHEAQAFGLATPLGINSTTGVAGLTLGGGFGWLSRKHGMTVDNLVAADVITADGEFLRASETEHPDLFWALRGGGGNFGIVTRFEFELHPVGPETISGLIVFPIEEAKSILHKYREFVKQMPDEMNIWCVLRKAPPLPFLPEAVHGTSIIALAVFHAGSDAEAEEALAPLRGFGNPLGEHIGLQPFKAWQAAFDSLLTPGARNYWKSHNFAELTDEAIEVVIQYAGSIPSPQCEIFIALLGGQVGRIAPDATAYPHRDANFVLNVHGRWDEPADDDRCISWSRDFFKDAEPYATGGVYINFMTDEESDRIPAAYGETFERLGRVKRKYDPRNFFRLNQNIKPVE